MLKILAHENTSPRLYINVISLKIELESDSDDSDEEPHKVFFNDPIFGDLEIKVENEFLLCCLTPERQRL